jgi:UDP-glucose 4-epimerase
MKFLLTGAFGYLGARLARSLAAASHEVIMTSRTLPPWRGVLDHVGRPAILDVLEPEAGAQHFEGVDTVVLLASLDENEAVRDPARALLVSAEGTRRTLDVALAQGVKNAIFLSTFHVYGPGAPDPVDEGAPARPAHPYAIAHLAGEGFAFAANAKAKRPFARVIRFSNGYGAPVHFDVDRWTLAHNDFCRQAAATGRIVLKSSGLQHRDFVWIEDLAQAISLLSQAPDDTLGDPVFHVGGGLSLSVRHVAERVAVRARAHFGVSVVIDALAPRADEREVPVRFDISRMRSLGYTPHDALDAETDALLSLAGMRYA